MPPPSPCSQRFQFYVPMLRAHSGYLSWIVSNGVGVEIQDLLYPSDSPPLKGRLAEMERFWKKTLAGEPLPVSLHGPPIERLLREEDRAKEGLLEMEGAMDVARGIGARLFIVHPQMGPRRQAPPNDLTRGTWETVLQAARARGLTLLLENTDEDGPEGLRELCDSIRSPSLGLCLDVGHAHRRSSRKCGEWLSAFGEDLLYVHLYNSSSEGTEAHRALGDGEIDIEGILGSLKSSRPDAPICLEMDVPQILASVPWLTARGFFKLKPMQADPF